MLIDYASHYDADYWKGTKKYRDVHGQTRDYHGPGLAWEGFQIIVDAVAPLLPGKRLLDIGCGGGDLAARFLQKGYDAYGIDISKHALENCTPSMQGRLALGDITTCPDMLVGAHLARLTDFGEDDPPASLPFPDKFDVVLATDLLEHLYMEDLDKTFDWMVSKTNRWMFFCVATVHDPQNPASYKYAQEFIHKKGEPVPIQFESLAVAGHVNVRSANYWRKLFLTKKLRIRFDLMYYFQMLREADPGLRITWGWCLPNTWILEKV